MDAVITSRELSDQVRRVLSSHRWSLQQASIHTGIGVGLIHKMSRGLRPRESSVREWARAIGEDEWKWLEWAGYDFGRPPGSPAAPASATENGITEAVAHLTREAARKAALSEEEEEVLAYYDGLPNGDLEAVRRILEGMYHARAAEPGKQP